MLLTPRELGWAGQEEGHTAGSQSSDSGQSLSRTHVPPRALGGFLGGDAIRVFKDEQVSARTTVQRSPGVPREAGKVGAVGRLEAGAEAAGERSACLARI